MFFKTPHRSGTSWLLPFNLGTRRENRRRALAVLLTFLLFALVYPAAWADPPQWAPGRILVQARSGVDDWRLEDVLARHGARTVSILEKIKVHIVSVPPQAEEAVARALAHNPNIAFAEPDRLLPPGEIHPDDPQYPNQWHLPLMNAPGAWDYTLGDGVVAAVLDTGVDATHADLAGKLVPGWNIYNNNADTSDIYGHGTKVAGVIGAADDDGLGVASLSWNTMIMPVRISRDDGYAYYSTIASGLTWAADHGAHVANISYMVTGSSTVGSAAAYFRERGGVVFASAGNSGALESVLDSETIISVAATTSSDDRASWSSYGDFVDLAAPGAGIVTTMRGGGYASVSGTSFSSPAAAAVGALVLAINPVLSPSRVEQVIESTPVDLGTTGWDIYYGHGRVDALAAILAALETSETADTQAPSAAILAPTGGTVSGDVAVDVSASDNVGVINVALYADGSFVAEDTEPPFQFTVDTLLHGDGSLTLTATALDAAGNQGNSEPVTVTVDNTPDPVDTEAPAVVILNPSDGTTLEKLVRIQMSASDNAGVTRLGCYVDGKLLGETEGDFLSINWNTWKAADGNHTITGEAWDAAGNLAETTITVVKPADTLKTSQNSN